MLHLARHSAFTPQDLQKMMGFSVGFDSIFDRFFDMDLTRDTGYPPYNIRKIDETQYVIEIALAGFSKEDIEVATEQNILTIRSYPKEKEAVKYTHKGIANRSFSKSWQLGEDTEVENVDYKDGMLTVTIQKIVPEEKQKKIWFSGNKELEATK